VPFARRRGFTLVELAVTVAILGGLIVAFLAVTSNRARDVDDAAGQYVGDNREAWDQMGRFKIECPPGVDPLEDDVDCVIEGQDGIFLTTLSLSYGSLTFNPTIDSQVFSPTVLGATGALSFTYAGDPLPQGVTFDQATGVFVGPGPWSIAATQISAGNLHTCAVVVDGTARCWGSGSSGRLGDGGTSSRNTPRLVQVSGTNAILNNVQQISAGSAHTCALLTDTGVKCWGSSANGRLGNGSVGAGSVTRAVDVVVPLNPDDPGSGTEPLLGAIQVSSGNAHTCAVMNNGGGVKCWGINTSGRLGDGTTDQSAYPVDVVVPLDPANPGLGTEPLTGIVQVTASAEHTCAVHQNGTAYCWGANTNGRLGDNTTTAKPYATLVVRPDDGLGPLQSVSQISSTGGTTCARTTQGAVFCWGLGTSGQIGNGGILSVSLPTQVLGLAGVVQVNAGGTHNCATTTQGAVFCWGAGADGRLGDGFAFNRAQPALVLGLNSANAFATAGERHSCALSVYGDVRCWGLGTSGQLGNGASISQVTFVNTSTLSNPGWPANGLVTVTDSVGATRTRQILLRRN
jgi:prepilin-type N-terminal cleavage/methylation domain-containing protein